MCVHAFAHVQYCNDYSEENCIITDILLGIVHDFHATSSETNVFSFSMNL